MGVVEDDDVGGVPGLEESEPVAEPERAGGDGRECCDGGGCRDADLQRCAQRRVLREGRARYRRRSREVGEPVPHADVERAETVVAVVRACRRHGIGDKSHATGRLLEQQPRDIGMHVLAVEDQLQRHPPVFERGHHGSRRAMMDAGHGIEGVRQHARPCIECGTGLLGGGLGMPDRDDHSGVDELRDGVERSGQLGASVSWHSVPRAAAMSPSRSAESGARR